MTQWLDDFEAQKDIGPVTVAANKNGLALDVVRCRDRGRKPPRLAPEYFDAAIALGALGRANERGGIDAAVATADAVLRALKPDGRLVFVEPAGCEAILAAALDDSPWVADCDARAENGAILGVVTRGADPAKRNTKGFA